MFVIQRIILIIAATTVLLARSRLCSAKPLGEATSMPPQVTSLKDRAEAVCTALEYLATSNISSPHLLGTFPLECLDTARSFFNSSIARVIWRWALVRQGEGPRPGYNFLPLTTVPTGCMLRLDVLDDPNAEDQFAIVQLADDFRALFNKCVRGRVHDVAAGYIPVGPRQVLKLYIGPTPGMVGAHEDTLER